MLRKHLKSAPIVILGLLIIFAPTAEAGRKVDPNIPQLGLWLKENSELTTMSSAIFGKADKNSRDSLDWKKCGEITSKICTEAEEIEILHFLPVCANAEEVNCLSGAWAIDPTGKRIDGVPLKRVPEKGDADFAAQPLMKMPAGVGSGQLYQFPGVMNSGGSDRYFIAVRNQFNITKKSGVVATGTEYSINSFRAGIIPVTELIGGNNIVRLINDGSGSGFGPNGGGGAPDGTECVSTDVAYCLYQQDFPAEYKFGLKIRVSRTLTGWFHGRIHNPLIETTVVDKGQEVSIQAEPVRVAALDYLAPVAQYSKEAKDAIFADREWGISSNDKGTKIVAGLDTEEARDLFKLFNPVFKDTSSYDKTYWTVNTLDYTRDGTIEKCSDASGKLAGVVTTNSLLYSAGPPSFNKETDSLDYQLASPHFEKSGKVATGSYDLLIRADVARCIYGFSKAPIKATISILSNEGDANVATTVLGEKNGWLFVSAQGFHFSTPIVRVKLSQDAPEPTPSASATSKIVKITCQKGSQKKVISGSKPSCPKGYKKIK